MRSQKLFEMRNAPTEMNEVEEESFSCRWMWTEPNLEVAVRTLPVGPFGGDGAHGGADGARVVDIERLQDK